MINRNSIKEITIKLFHVFQNTKAQKIQITQDTRKLSKKKKKADWRYSTVGRALDLHTADSSWIPISHMVS